MDKKIRVLLVEDELIVCEATNALLKIEATIQVVGEAVSAEMCLQKAHALRPDVILLDLRLPDRPGVDVINALLQDNPNVRIVILTGYADDEEVVAAFRAGAVGYVLKTQASSDLVRAIENAHKGHSSVPPRVAKIMLQTLNPPKPIPVASDLSQAERRVLVYLAQGLQNKEIAHILGVTQPTVHVHICHILTKLHLTNRTQAAIYAVQQGLASLVQLG